MIPWLEEMRPRIPAKAYYGCLGWAVAKHVATVDRLGALKLYSVRGRARLLPAGAGGDRLPADFPVRPPLSQGRGRRDPVAARRASDRRAEPGVKRVSRR